MVIKEGSLEGDGDSGLGALVLVRRAENGTPSSWISNFWVLWLECIGPSAKETEIDLIQKIFC